jgi:benzoyl-CoA reductase/2-hydroxyglutaryl-CoA dehydratase subunit BcrC/BadD/HgdB
VAALDLCIGARHYDTLVDEDTADPFKALAKRYLTRTPCARMMGFEEQYLHLQELCGQFAAQGIICSHVKYCDPLLYHLPLIEQRLREQGIPFLALENDYTWDDLGQTKTRVETFIAMVPEVRHV